jgi:ankyrin repeat protein
MKFFLIKMIYIISFKMDRPPIDSFVDQLAIPQNLPSCENLTVDERVNKVLEYFNGNINIQDEYGNTFLHHAIKNRDVKMCEAILKRGGDPNIMNQEGNTPLIHCIFYGTYDIAVLLLEYGGDPLIPDFVGDDCFYHANLRNNTKVLELLQLYCFK